MAGLKMTANGKHCTSHKTKVAHSFCTRGKEKERGRLREGEREKERKREKLSLTSLPEHCPYVNHNTTFLTS